MVARTGCSRDRNGHSSFSHHLVRDGTTTMTRVNINRWMKIDESCSRSTMVNATMTVMGNPTTRGNTSVTRNRTSYYRCMSNVTSTSIPMSGSYGTTSTSCGRSWRWFRYRMTSAGRAEDVSHTLDRSTGESATSIRRTVNTNGVHVHDVR